MIIIVLMAKFFLIGSSGYIAKKHIECIYKSNGELITACDIKTDGFLDRYFPDANFTYDIPYFSDPSHTHLGEPAGDAVAGDNLQSLCPP